MNIVEWCHTRLNSTQTVTFCNNKYNQVFEITMSDKQRNFKVMRSIPSDIVSLMEDDRFIECIDAVYLELVCGRKEDLIPYQGKEGYRHTK